MTNLGKYAALILLSPLLLQSCFGQHLGEYWLQNKEESAISSMAYGMIWLLDSGRFEYNGGICLANWHTSGTWTIIQDTLILTSDKLKHDYIPQIAEISEFTYDQSGVNFSLQIYLEEESDSTKSIVGQPGIEMTIYGNGESIHCQTDSMGNVFIQEISEIDSIMIKEFNSYQNYKIIPQNDGVNAITAAFDLWEIFDNSTQNSNYTVFENKAYLMREETFISTDTNSIYKKKK